MRAITTATPGVCQGVLDLPTTPSLETYAAALWTAFHQEGHEDRVQVCDRAESALLLDTEAEHTRLLINTGPKECTLRSDETTPSIHETDPRPGARHDECVVYGDDATPAWMRSNHEWLADHCHRISLLHEGVEGFRQTDVSLPMECLRSE